MHGRLSIRGRGAKKDGFIVPTSEQARLGRAVSCQLDKKGLHDTFRHEVALQNDFMGHLKSGSLALYIHLSGLYYSLFC